MGKPSVMGLTMECCIIHNIIGYYILPRAGHRDEVTYLETFIINSILMERRLHLRHIIIHHMLACCKKKKRTLPYDRILIKKFEVKGIDLSREPNIDIPSPYNTINESTLSRMKIYKMRNETWAKGTREEGDSDNEEVGDKEDEDIENMEGGIDQ